jgi:hypothetical protein
MVNLDDCFGMAARMDVWNRFLEEHTVPAARVFRAAEQFLSGGAGPIQ